MPDILDSIDWGTSVSSTEVTVYFAAAGETFAGVTSQGWTLYETSRAMAALNEYALVSNLTFTISTDPATATFKLVAAFAEDFGSPGTLGAMIPPGEAEAGVGVFAIDGAGWDAVGGLEQGGLGYYTLLHEFGHGLGLAHPHDNGGTSEIMQGVTGPGSYGDFSLNQGVFTVMSYNFGWDLNPVGGSPSLYYGLSGGLAALDIAIIQSKYGVGENNEGDTVYYLPTGNAAGTFYETIFDTGGTDTIVNDSGLASFISLQAATIDYSATGGGVISYVGGVHGGYTIAQGVTVENALGGTGADIIVGNAAANVLDGGAGVDELYGLAGDDTYWVDEEGDDVIEAEAEGADTVVTTLAVYTLLPEHVEDLIYAGTPTIDFVGGGNALDNYLEGWDGDDTLNGREGADTMVGLAGDDTYWVDDVGDQVVEATTGGTADAVNTTLATYQLGANVEDLVYFGTSTANFTGTGNGLDNFLVGWDGNDSLDGAGGADTMFGEKGNDVYTIDVAGDQIIEAADEGTDEIRTGLAVYSLAALANVESLTGTSSSGQQLTGNGAANLIAGGSGNDRLDGGAAADTMTGGGGDDTFVVDNAGDTTSEVGEGGTDAVESSISHSLAEEVENLILTGTAAIDGTGNDDANSLTGNSGANRLDGGLGADTMTGGGGNDTFVVDNAGDTTTEADGGGTDTVESSISRTLAPEIENLVLTGTAAIDGTGNGDPNSLTGNSGANRLDGGVGADTMVGGGGNDLYLVDNGGDTANEALSGGTDTVHSSVSFTLGDHVENLVLTAGLLAVDGNGNGLANSLTGNALANRLDGKGAADTMTGGLGNDTYVVDIWAAAPAPGTPVDLVVEDAAGGTDTVESGVTYVLGLNVENLVLTGTAVDGTGNGLANSLAGNGGANRLDGKEGSDTMAGGAGNDTYFVDAAGDTVTEAAAGGTDTVESSVTFTLASEVENLVLTGVAAIAGTGNSGVNSLTGNGAANRLDGAVGADTMTGGGGNDTYIVDNVGDTANESATAAEGGGTDTVESSVGYVLAANVENLVLTGTAIGGAGNALVNRITGNDAANRLDGKAGADTMTGGAGDDTYVVDTWTVSTTTADDTVVEAAGAGTDTVESKVTYVLGANVENLVLIGIDAINGTGNELVNSLTGNAAANILDGKAGADTMSGGGGNDSYWIDNALDKIVETAIDASIDSATTTVSYTLGAGVRLETLTAQAAAASALNLTGNELANTLYGHTGNNVLDGKGGADTMDGGDGSDTYYVDDIGDKVNEGFFGDVDTVYSSVNFATNRQIERIFLTGTAPLSGTATTASTITGNSAANRLDAGTMIGGLGDDTYIVKFSGQKVVEGASAGIDTVLASTAYTLTEHVENLTLSGTVGHSLTGNGIANVITGNAADNVIDGKAGADTMKGGAGNDFYYVDTFTSSTSTPDDLVVEAIDGGNDSVASTVTYVLPANVEGLALAGTAAINGTGNELVNNLTGNIAANRLDGKAGADVMQGGAGNDTYIVDNARDQVLDHDDTVGVDTVITSVTYKLAAGSRIEVVTTADVAGTALINLTGNEFDNRLTGNAGANILNGGEGADTLSGAGGNDTYFVDSRLDKVVETATTGSVDTVKALGSYELGAGVRVENLTAADSARTDFISLTGNEFANSLTGNAGANELNGRGGADTMTGGAGNDSYVVDTFSSSTGTPSDRVVEAAGAGTDSVLAYVSYILPDNVEKLVLAGNANLNGTGNAANNFLTGNDGANRLDGKAGADTMEGSSGDDTYVVDNALDQIIEYDWDGGVDTVITSISYIIGEEEMVERLATSDAAGAAALNLTGNSWANSLFGNAGANRLDGGGGADVMSGGDGNDTYLIDEQFDKIVETATTGSIDVARTSVSYTLGAGVRVETLTTLNAAGFELIHLTGNELANNLVGNATSNELNGGAGNDVLAGGGGDDRLYGGAGNDTLQGDAARDTFWFDTALGAANVDKIVGFVAADDSILLDRDIFTGILADGQLAVDDFRVGTAAGDASDRIIYDKATGRIFYDADGIGGTAQILFATVAAGTVLTHADFGAVI